MSGIHSLNFWSLRIKLWWILKLSQEEPMLWCGKLNCQPQSWHPIWMEINFCLLPSCLHAPCIACPFNLLWLLTLREPCRTVLVCYRKDSFVTGCMFQAPFSINVFWKHSSWSISWAFCSTKVEAVNEDEDLTLENGTD